MRQVPRQLSVLIYPETGTATKKLVLNACLYFDRVYVLGPWFPKERATEILERLQVPRTGKILDKSLTLGSEQYIEMARDSVAFYDSVSPLKEKGILEFVREVEGSSGAVRKTARDWLDRLFEELPGGTEAPESNYISLHECSSPMGDWRLTEVEMHTLMESGLPPGTEWRKWTKSFESVENARAAAHFLSLVDIASYASFLQSQLLTDSLAHEVFFADLLDWLPQIREELGAPLDQTESMLAHAVISTHVPILETVEAEDILEVRLKLADEYGSFRTELASLAATVESDPWHPDMAAEVERIVRHDIDPAVERLRRALKGARWTFLKHLAGDLDSLFRSAVPFAGSVVAGFALEQAAAVGLAAGLGGALLSTKLDSVEAKRRNAFSYVLEVQQRVARGYRRRKRVEMRLGDG